MNADLLIEGLREFNPIFIEGDGSYDDSVEIGDLELQMPRRGGLIVNYYDDVEQALIEVKAFPRNACEDDVVAFIRETLE